MIRIAIITLCFIMFDVLTGFLKAWTKHNIDSSALRRGLMHKLSEIISIVFAFLCEYAVNYISIGIKIPFVIAVCTYIVIMEIISIIENICEANPDMMKFFQKYLSKLKEGVEDESLLVHDDEAKQLDEDSDQRG